MMRYFLIVFFWIFHSICAQAEINFLTISDLHYDSNDKTGDGQDTNAVLLSLALEKFTQLSQKVDFILCLGDLPGHGFMGSYKKEKEEIKVLNDLYNADTFKKPMFYIAGNNDSLQGNYQSFMWDGKSPLTLTKEWSSACIYCDGLMIDQTHMKDAGYYSSLVIPGNKDIMLIALNSVQFADRAWYQPRYPNQDEEAYKQLDWFEEQLKTHSANQLLIAMHMPPGINYKGNAIWVEKFQKRFISILRAYQQNFSEINVLVAHNHRDELRKITLSNHNVYAFSTPSISRIYYNYPSMKIFNLDSTLKLKNFTTYYTTSDSTWSDEHYDAIGKDNSIFPNCLGMNLASCLDSQNVNSICNAIEDGLFYGVKSTRVDNSVCRSNYPVN